MGSRRLVPLVTALVLATALLGTGTATAKKAKALAAPQGLPDFYEVPQPLPKKPGTLIKSERIPADDVHGTVYRVMYVSQSQHGKPRAVTGVIAVPDADPPDGGYPVVSWAHGTDGMADQCAPSIDSAHTAGDFNAILDKGWLFTATDYEGEGTPGLHPYIAGENAARNTIDIVRAARHLRKAHASTDYAVWGHSQGGHTAMFTLKIADDYAPELDIHGVVAGAPPSQFAFIYGYLKTSPFRHYLLMAAGGLNAAYGDKDLPLDEVLTPKGIDLLSALEDGCAGDLQARFADTQFDEIIKSDPFTVPHWKKVLKADDPTNFSDAVDTPLLIVQGGNDEQIPVASTDLLRGDLCDIGQQLERWIYPGQSHAGVIGPSLGDTLSWIEARFNGDDPGSVTPTGLPNVEVTGCDSAAPS